MNITGYNGLKMWTTAALAIFIAAAPVYAVNGTTQPCPIGGYTAVGCPVVTDSVIQQIVASRLAGAVATRDCPVVVQVLNGRVTLSGQVSTAEQRQLASLLATTVRGVISVDNRLAISAAGSRDLSLVRDVKYALNQAPFDSRRVVVEASEGIVRLRGMVDSDYVRSQAEQIAFAVPGVTGVQNNLTVQETSETGGIV